MVIRLPRDLLIFSAPIWSRPLCIQYLTKGFLPVKLSDWAISFSWWGKTTSCPPPWMSICSPRYLIDMALHSMCQPGRPGPHGESHEGSPGLEAFQRTKSIGSSLPSPASTRAPAIICSRLRLESLP